MSDIKIALKGFSERRRVADQAPEPLRSYLFAKLAEQEDALKAMQQRDADRD